MRLRMTIKRSQLELLARGQGAYGNMSLVAVKACAGYASGSPDAPLALAAPPFDDFSPCSVTFGTCLVFRS